MLKETKKILMAPDGGAKAFKGSLGLVITDDAKHSHGRTAGHDSLSFRTKSSTFLVAL